MSQVATAVPVSPDAGLAALVRVRTKDVHRAAERAGFIADLLRGKATSTGYAVFLRNLHPVYVALETALAASAGSPPADIFADPRLHRLEPLAADLRALAGADWSSLPLLPEASTYATAISDYAGDPACLAGHAYARYLGDLSGGQILKPLLARTLGLTPDALAFYDFPAYDDLAAPKLTIRAALDAVPVDSRAGDAVCEAAVAAFHHNIALSEAVQASLAPA